MIVVELIAVVEIADLAAVTIVFVLVNLVVVGSGFVAVVVVAVRVVVGGGGGGGVVVVGHVVPAGRAVVGVIPVVEVNVVVAMVVVMIFVELERCQLTSWKVIVPLFAKSSALSISIDLLMISTHCLS